MNHQFQSEKKRLGKNSAQKPLNFRENGTSPRSAPKKATNSRELGNGMLWNNTRIAGELTLIAAQETAICRTNERPLRHTGSEKDQPSTLKPDEPYKLNPRLRQLARHDWLPVRTELDRIIAQIAGLVNRFEYRPPISPHVRGLFCGNRSVFRVGLIRRCVQYAKHRSHK